MFVCRRQTVIFDENATVWAPSAVEDVKKMKKHMKRNVLLSYILHCSLWLTVLLCILRER